MSPRAPRRDEGPSIAVMTLAPLSGAGVAWEIFREVELLFEDFRRDRFRGLTAVGAPAALRRLVSSSDNAVY